MVVVQTESVMSVWAGLCNVRTLVNRCLYSGTLSTYNIKYQIRSSVEMCILVIQGLSLIKFSNYSFIEVYLLE